MLSIDGASSLDLVQYPDITIRVFDVSQLTVTFDVDELSSWRISNSLYDAISTVSTADDYLRIVDVDDPNTPLFDLLPSGGGTFDGTGALVPGTYRLEAQIKHDILTNGSASQDLGFSFLVVPEPSAALLVGLGTACLSAVGH